MAQRTGGQGSRARARPDRVRGWIARACSGALALAAACAGAGAHAGADEINFRLHCSGCHQPDGRGIPAGGVPSMRDSLGYFLHSPEGRAFLVQVPGTSQSPLTNAQVASMLNWMIGAFSAAQAPSAYPAFTEAEVATLRARRLDDVMGTRREIVAALRARGLDIR